MTVLVGARVQAEVVATGERLSLQCRRSGDWATAADWLARELNKLARYSTDYVASGLEARLRVSEMISIRVSAVHGDHREADVIRLPDGTRACWHLGTRRGDTGWVAEAAGDRCAFGRGG